MSRSRLSSHSRRNSARGDRNVPVTQPTIPDLGLSETAGSQHLSLPSSYHTSDSPYLRPSYPQTELTASYLESGYDPSSYSRASSLEGFIHPRCASPDPTFGISDPDPLSFSSIDPDAGNFHIQQNISDPASLSRPDMR